MLLFFFSGERNERTKKIWMTHQTWKYTKLKRNYTVIAKRHWSNIFILFFSLFLVNMSLQSDITLCTHNIRPVKWPLQNALTFAMLYKQKKKMNCCEKISERVATLIFNISHLRIESLLLFSFFVDAWMNNLFIHLPQRINLCCYCIIYYTTFSWNASLTSVNFNLPVVAFSK